MSTATAPAGVYRPRRPEGSPLYRLSEGDFERFVRVYDERFAHRCSQRPKTEPPQRPKTEPPGSNVIVGEGGGPGLGVREAEGARPFYITGDGLNWARFNPTFEICVEPIPALMRGEARVLSEMDGEVLVLGRSAEDEPAPVRTMLDEPFPNPFNPHVELAYSLASPGLVTLHVFDIKGRLVDTLVSENQPVA